jgi:hypothetical protein
MIKVLWGVVFLVAGLGFLLLLVSITQSAMSQASIGAMVGAFVVCAYVGMRAIEAMFAASPRRRDDH